MDDFFSFFLPAVWLVVDDAIFGLFPRVHPSPGNICLFYFIRFSLFFSSFYGYLEVRRCCEDEDGREEMRKEEE